MILLILVINSVYKFSLAVMAKEKLLMVEITANLNTTLEQSLLLFRGGVVVPFVVVVCNGLSCLALIMHRIVQCCTNNNVCLAICAVGNTYNK